MKRRRISQGAYLSVVSEAVHLSFGRQSSRFPLGIPSPPVLQVKDVDGTSRADSVKKSLGYHTRPAVPLNEEESHRIPDSWCCDSEKKQPNILFVNSCPYQESERQNVDDKGVVSSEIGPFEAQFFRMLRFPNFAMSIYSNQSREACSGQKNLGTSAICPSVSSSTKPARACLQLLWDS